MATTSSGGAALRRKVEPGHAAIEALRANGTDVVFGLNGDHVLKLYDGLSDTPSITHVTVKHENNAAIAAEAYGRLTGRPGVVVVTAGPGALNSISGVADALASGAPVVHLSGAVPSDAYLETFHGVDEVDFTERAFATVTKSSRRVTQSSDIHSAIDQAFSLAVSGRPGPVHVEITRDCLESSIFEADEPRRAPTPRPIVAPDLDKVRDRIKAARHPVIVAGKGAWYPIVSAALVRFAEALGIPVAHTWEGHGAMPTMHPLSLGPYRVMQTHPLVAAELNTADLVIGIGMRPGIEHEAALRKEVGDRLIILDAADRPSPGHTIAIGSIQSLAASLDALATSISPTRDTKAIRAICAESQRTVARGLEVELARYADTRPWHIGAAIAGLSERMTAETIVTTDVSNLKLWVPFQLRAFGPHSHVQAGSWGTMGYALPAAIGAAMAFPKRKVVALAGDTSFMMSWNDLSTIVQNKLPIVMGVHHDGRIGMINYMQVMAGRKPYATDIGDVAFAQVAEAAGMTGIKVSDPSEIGPAWDRALAADGPVLLEFMAGHEFPRPSIPRFVEQAG